MTHIHSSTSLLNQRWSYDDSVTPHAENLSARTGLSPVTLKYLIDRGLFELPDILRFMSPKMSELKDPLHLKDMSKAVDKICSYLEAHVKNKKTSHAGFAVFGDYDVDGGCASALLIRFFNALGVDPILYVPDRMTEGYGPNVDAMDHLKKEGAECVITVDCGSVAFEPMRYAKALGLDVIITDHHQTTPEIPECVALINPNRVDETSDYTMLSGAGVAFYLALAVTRQLREKGFFESENIKEPDNRYLLDLVAVSTVCDMVPLTGPNRVLVQQGLKGLNMFHNKGFKALAHITQTEEALSTYHAGFVIGPRINAGGRLSDCHLGAKLLSTESQEEAETLATTLHNLNEERKEIETQVLEEALSIAEEKMKKNPNSLVIAGQGWHEGVIGIVASRVKEAFHRPTFVLSLHGEEAKGSGRSIKGIDIGKSVIDLKHLLLKGGGHKMAAGISLKSNAIDDFEKAFEAHVKTQADKIEGSVFIKSLTITEYLTVESATPELLTELEKLEPFGVGNYEPRFAFQNVKVAFAKMVGQEQNHVTFTLKGDRGGILKGIAFKAVETPLGSALLHAAKTKTTLTLCGYLRKNTWQGRTHAQLILHDAQNML